MTEENEDFDEEQLQDGLDEIAEEDEPAEIETVTVVSATNADVMDVLFGEYDQRQVLTQAEFGDGTAFLVKRLYEPVGIIEFDEPQSPEDVQEWLADRPDHDALADYDWDQHERQVYFNAIVRERQQSKQALQTVAQQLQQVPAEAEETQRGLSQVLGTIQNVLNNSAPVQLDRVESPELAEEGT